METKLTCIVLFEDTSVRCSRTTDAKARCQESKCKDAVERDLGRAFHLHFPEQKSWNERCCDIDHTSEYLQSDVSHSNRRQHMANVKGLTRVDLHGDHKNVAGNAFSAWDIFVRCDKRSTLDTIAYGCNHRNGEVQEEDDEDDSFLPLFIGWQ